MTHVVSSHRTLKKHQNNDIWVSIGTFKEALQTDFSYFNKMKSFTNIVTNIKNHKNYKFSIKWHERLVFFSFLFLNFC